MKHDKSKNVKTSNSNEILHFVGVCFLSLAAVTAIILLAGSAAALQFAMPYGCFIATSHLILAANAFVLSWHITSRRRKKWLFNGILTGIGVFLFVSCISAVFHMFSFGTHLIPRTITCIFSGMLGSYMAINKRKRKRG